MEVICPSCGEPLSVRAPELSGSAEAVCPGCSERFTIREAPKGSQGRDAGEEPDEPLGEVTIFQPGVTLGSLFPDEVDDGEPGPAGAVGAEASGTQTAVGSPDFTPPPLRLDVEAFFQVLGAAPGEERIDLERARTVFGRTGADVELPDSAVSKRHFQVDVMGRELFIRDLDSRHGTFLNGRPVRYTELVPGDEVRAGRTVMVFRTAGDGLGRGSDS